MNHISKLKIISCAYWLCFTHSPSYASPKFLKRIFPCCYNESPLTSPCQVQSNNTQPKIDLGAFLILGAVQNPAAAPRFSLTTTQKTEEHEEEMLTIVRPVVPPLPLKDTNFDNSSPTLAIATTPLNSSAKSYDEMHARHFTWTSTPQSPQQKLSPPPSLIPQDKNLRGSSDSFVMVSPIKNDFEI